MDRELAATLARLSALAYEDLGTVIAALPSAEVALLDIDDTQAYLVVRSDGVAIVAFRGTQVTANWSWPDIKTNILQRRVPWLGNSEQEVHGGYGEAFLDVLPDIRIFAGNCRAQGMHVYFTGHSLGGALATLAGSVMDASATYTFGAPRVGNSKFANAIADKNVHRIVYGRDIAPSYPHPLLGYRHGGKRWQLHSNGTLIRGGTWRDLLHFTLVAGVLDHRVANYADSLAQRHHDRRLNT